MNAMKSPKAEAVPLSWFVTRLPVVLPVLILAILTQSCFPLFYVDRSYNLTRKPRFHGGYSLNAEYQTKRNLLYDGNHLADSLRIPGPGKYDATIIYCDPNMISRPDDPALSRNVTVTDYDHYMKSHPEHPGVTLVPKGTRFRFVEMRLTDNPWIGARESLTGEFTDEPLANRRLRLDEVSTCFPNGTGIPRKTEKFGRYDVALFWPDPDHIELVPGGGRQNKATPKGDP